MPHATQIKPHQEEDMYSVEEDFVAESIEDVIEDAIEDFYE